MAPGHLRAADKALFATQRPADLRKEAEENAPLLGRVPKGTVVRYQGKSKNGFVQVEVELVQGSVAGWLPVMAAPKRFQEESTAVVDAEDSQDKLRRSDDTEESEVTSRPSRRVKVPSDEGILLRREPTFFYGVQAGGGAALLDAGVVSADYFVGPSLFGGGHVGYFLSRAIPVRFELNYNLEAGSEPTRKIAPISVGFVHAGVSISYLLEQFEMFGGLSYGIGISVSDIDPKIKVAGPQDFSSVFFNAGAGYIFNLNDITNLALRLRYDFSFNRAPVGFQSIAGLIYLEFRG